jgi:hypothetical protein
LSGFAIASCLLVGGFGVGGEEAFLIVTFAGTSFFTATFFTGAFATLTAFFTAFALGAGLRDFETAFGFGEPFFAALTAFLFVFAMILYLPGVLKKIGKNTGSGLKQKMSRH